MAIVEDFEDTAVGVFPSGWVGHYISNGNVYVTDSRYKHGKKSLYIKSINSGSLGVEYDGPFGQSIFSAFFYPTDVTVGWFNIGVRHAWTTANIIGVFSVKDGWMYVNDADGKHTLGLASPLNGKWNEMRIIFDWLNNSFTLYVNGVQQGGSWRMISTNSFELVSILVGGLGEVFVDYIRIYDTYDIEKDMVAPPTMGKLGAVATNRNDISYKRTLGNKPLENKYVSGTTAQQSFTATSDIKALGVWLTADNETTVTVSIYTIGGTLVAQRDFGIVGNDREEFIFDFGDKINLITGNDYYFKLESEKTVEFGYDTDDQMLFSIYSEAGVFITGAAGKSLTEIATALYKWLDTARWKQHAQIYIDSSGNITSDGTSTASISWDGTEHAVTLSDTFREFDLSAIAGEVDVGTATGYRAHLDTHQTLHLKEDVGTLYISGTPSSELSGTMYKEGLLSS